jgi:hypothetical protein
VGAKVHAKFGPGVEVVRRGDGAADALAGANAPVLCKGGGSLDGGSVRAGRRVNVVGTAVGGDASLERGPRAGVVSSIALDDVAGLDVSPGPACGASSFFSLLGV